MKRVALLLLCCTVPANAGELRDLCPDRPGNATPPCIVDAGHLQVETGIVGWTHSRHGDAQSDALAFAATELRLGLSDTLEAELAFSPYNSLTTRDRSLGTRSHDEGIGDLTVSIRKSLAHPDGKGLSVAIEPYLVAPTGHSGIGGGDWAVGVLLPFAAELGSGFGLGATPQLAWVPNASGSGHHGAYTGVVALSHAIGPFQAGTEFWLRRDSDPDAATTQATADITLAWLPKGNGNIQFDLGAYLGVNRDTPQLQAYVGVSRRF